MYALNFYSDLYEKILRSNRKSATIRLGDKSDKYKAGMLTWVTVGQRFQTRQRLFTAVLDRVEVKPISELNPRDIKAENPEMRSQDDVIAMLSRLYSEKFITPAHNVTVIYFSRIND